MTESEISEWAANLNRRGMGENADDVGSVLFSGRCPKLKGALS